MASGLIRPRHLGQAGTSTAKVRAAHYRFGGDTWAVTPLVRYGQRWSLNLGTTWYFER